jgi:pyruvate/2-oxoacid:ferredoxin oxidoreductase alpha subunit
MTGEPTEADQQLPVNVKTYQEKFKKIYQISHAPVEEIEHYYRKRKSGLTDDEMLMLQQDLLKGVLTKDELKKKYDIAESTIKRYIRKFKDLQNQEHYGPDLLS